MPNTFPTQKQTPEPISGSRPLSFRCLNKIKSIRHRFPITPKNFPWLVATPNLCSHAHTYTSSHTHTTRISKRKRDKRSHTTLAKWGSVSRKNKNLNKNKRIRLDKIFFRRCRQIVYWIVR